MTDSQKLLADYVENGSETAFRELVSRYLNLVYSTAARLVNGDTHLAEDVSQIVFTDLARLARMLSKDVMLGGWLHRHTCFVAAKTMRTNSRRQFREKQVVEMNAQQDHSSANLAQVAPLLDEAINQLRARDRAAILLRFFEQHDLRSVGEALGISENAAQKRLTRALERLRTFLTRRGVALSAAGLATSLASAAGTAAPAGLAISIPGAALAGAAAGGGTSLTLLKLMTMTKLKAGVIAAVVVAGVATPLAVQLQTQVKLRGENHVLRQQVDQLAQLQIENGRLADLLARANGSQLSKEQSSELMKLRGEVGLLRKQTNDLEKLRAENRRLQTSLTKVDQSAEKPENDPVVEQQKQASMAKMNDAKVLVLAFRLYAMDNKGQYPKSFDQIATYLAKIPDITETTAPALSGTNEFEIVYQGTLDTPTNEASVIMLREKQAWQYTSGRWAKTYGFEDGHVEVHGSDDGNFEAWEKQHMISTAQSGQ